MERTAKRDGMNPYEALEVSENATKEEIRAAYRRKAKSLHPDRGGDTDKMSEVNRAYALLSNPDLRDRYDRGEEVKPKSIEDEAKEQLCSMWLQALSQVQDRDPEDLLAAIKRVVKEGVKKCQAEAGKQRRRMNKLEKVKKYLKPSAISPGLLEHVLEEKLAEGRKILAQIEKAESMGPLVLELLKTYSWDGPPSKVEIVGGQPTHIFVWDEVK